MSLEAQLAEVLAGLAARGETVAYGELARRLAIAGPGSIAQLTDGLEALMREDAAAGRPFRAALLASRIGDGLPARGFFEMARRLGRFDGPDSGPEAAAFVAAERRALMH